MTATKVIELLLQQGPVGGRQLSGRQTDMPWAQPELASSIVQILLRTKEKNPLGEATMHRPKRGRVWVATFTGPEGGQVWRSTGVTDHDQALLIAKKWEREARAQRAKSVRTPRQSIVHLQQRELGSEPGLLTQREVGLLLGISQRSVRRLERSAIAKLRRHPMLREIWQKYLAGELEETRLVLTRAEAVAMLGLVRSPEERL